MDRKNSAAPASSSLPESWNAGDVCDCIQSVVDILDGILRDWRVADGSGTTIDDHQVERRLIGYRLCPSLASNDWPDTELAAMWFSMGIITPGFGEKFAAKLEDDIGGFLFAHTKTYIAYDDDGPDFDRGVIRIPGETRLMRVWRGRFSLLLKFLMNASICVRGLAINEKAPEGKRRSDGAIIIGSGQGLLPFRRNLIALSPPLLTTDDKATDVSAAVQQPTETKKAPWWKSQAPPADGWHQEPVTGTLSAIAQAMKTRPANLEAKAKKGRIWIDRENRTTFHVYFRISSDFEKVRDAMPPAQN